MARPCCRLVPAAAAAAVYALVAYIVAFTIELWWILDAEVRLPAPAYLLCAAYLLSFILAAVLLHGLTAKRSPLLLVWLFTAVILALPEAGLVLFLSLYFWQLTSLNGMTELVFWICRLICNVGEVGCVRALYRCWREEKHLLRTLQQLHTASSQGIQNAAFMGSGSLAPSPRAPHRAVVPVRQAVPLHLPLGSGSEFNASTFHTALQRHWAVNPTQVLPQRPPRLTRTRSMVDIRTWQGSASNGLVRSHSLLDLRNIELASNRQWHPRMGPGVMHGSRPSLADSIDGAHRLRDVAL
ncbi:uncharacterized protein LOC124544781 isoform X1 [Schistocerca americana]|uniref:uncharacterized protein LOC124544781 isoform X1 n=1 Tax=Schistocerca americana TaxID=7009 RepID=UPI001F4FE2CD|nr:uncharacterized protein LOC124544781 isoform X1 [Schistocerca americana]XP_049942310.1 uncharacterized protein LOC126419219 isoform X1 [Schistocerca serialis cubense]